jgi:hypothetical protein
MNKYAIWLALSQIFFEKIIVKNFEQVDFTLSPEWIYFHLAIFKILLKYCLTFKQLLNNMLICQVRYEMKKCFRQLPTP